MHFGLKKIEENCQAAILFAYMPFLYVTSDFIVGIRIGSVKSVASYRNRTRDPSHPMRRRRPLSHGAYRDLTYLSWYLTGFSIDYIYNWQLTQQADYTMFRWFLVGRDNTEV